MPSDDDLDELIERITVATTTSVLDIEPPVSEQATAQVIAAYKRGLGII